ncbi:glycosyltransferase [Achromobacter pulmonis]|uniref:glycosyltransferase n=1 Tax=Achromobacter pulmonis TaxID=1389932 RepID=UPI001F3B434A|nr:glycosyltransferase [Achromobacter pulmonis]MCF7767865.1 glycosyltransferase [Achromobacter pulmonis]
MRVPSPSVVMLTADRQIDRRILQQAQSLRSHGWQVTLIAMPLDDSNRAQEGSEVVRVGASQDSPAPRRENFILSVYRVLRGLVPMNGRTMRLAKRLAWRYFVDQEQFYQRLYGEAALRFTPTVFVAHDLPMLAVARQAAQACGARLVYDSHELYAEQEFSPFERNKWRDIESKHIRACDAVITVNPSIARELEQRYRLTAPVNVIYNAAPLETQTESSRIFHEMLHLPPTARVLLMQGGLSAGRNIETLVQAMSRVRNQDVHLVLLGDGQLKQQMTQLASQLKISRRVHFLSAVPQEALPSYTAGADAGSIPYLATCLNNRYCTPNKLFEYVAAQLPILASDLPEIARIVRQFDLGLTVDFNGAESVAKGIEMFFSDPDRLDQWRHNAAVARSQLCWEEEEEKLISIFEAFR